MITDIEKKVIASIQGDIPVSQRPYLELAQKINISEDEFIAVVTGLIDKGIVRRFGATLRHQKSGFTANAMVAWSVDEECAKEVGTIMATFKEVSHCYRRDPAKGWPFNLYTMVHALSEEACLDTARRISEKVSAPEYSILFSVRELKKTSMKYFSEDKIIG